MKNAERQIFDHKYIGWSKAKAAEDRLSGSLPSIKSINDYIDFDKMNRILLSDNGQKKLNLVVTAVDNLATRKAVIDSLIDCNNKHNLSFIYVNCGNSLDTAHVSVWAMLKKTRYFLSPFDRYLDIANPEDLIPGRCSLAEPSTPQLITANNLSANMVLQTLQNILDGEPVYEEMNGYIRKQMQRPVGRPRIIPI